MTTFSVDIMEVGAAVSNLFASELRGGKLFTGSVHG